MPIIGSLTGSGSSGLRNSSKSASPTNFPRSNLHVDMSLSDVLPSLDALVASLQTCEVAAEATRTIGENFLTSACAQGLIQMRSQEDGLTAPPSRGPGLPSVIPKEATASHVGEKETPQNNAGELRVIEKPSALGSLQNHRSATVERPKRESVNNPNVFKQGSECASSHLSLPMEHLNSVAAGEFGAFPAISTCKRRRGNETSKTECVISSPSSSSLTVNSALGLRCTGSDALVMGPPTGRPPNALGGLRALNRRQGAAKQSRMTWRLESFRREAEEALRWQHNATVMNIFSTIDSHIRSFRGGTMSPSELDLRIMAVIDKCLPLQGDEARAVEAVLDMATVRRLKATLKGRPKNSGAFLDLIALSKLCRHIPGVCFDKWNLGWIATWREHRRPVHKHFSAKKYGFFRAREFAICYRSKMTSGLPIDGTEPPTVSRSVTAGGDLSPLHAQSDEVSSLATQQQHTKGKSRALEAEDLEPEADPTATTTRPTRRSRRFIPGRTLKVTGEVSPSSFTEAKTTQMALRRRTDDAWITTSGESPPTAAVDLEQQRRVTHAANEGMEGLAFDAFASKGGWADLVARTPRVERVSFDFTNQSWIAQWKQQGRTTYRRFAVSKYGFATAHRLAVEYKSKYFKEAPQQSSSSVGVTTTSSTSTAPASEDGAGDGATVAQEQQRSDATARCLSKGSRCSSSRLSEGLDTGSGDSNTEWLHSDLLEKTKVQKQPLRTAEIDCAGSGCPEMSSLALGQRQSQLEKQRERTMEDTTRKSDASLTSIKTLAEHVWLGNMRLACDRSPNEPSETGLVGDLEALLCFHEEGGMSGSSVVTESPEDCRCREGTSTTATPTSHTLTSVDSFPVTTVGCCSMQQPNSASVAGHASSHTDGRQMSMNHIEMQRTLLRLMQLSGQTADCERLQQQTHLASGEESSALEVNSPGKDIADQGVEMLRTAINCILLDMKATCTRCINPSGDELFYLDLLDYHLKFVDGVHELERFTPYSQLFAACLRDRTLPSSLPVARATEFLHGLRILFMQHQQRINHDEQLLQFLMMQAQQQRRLQQQQAAVDRQRLAVLQAQAFQVMSAKYGELRNQGPSAASAKGEVSEQARHRNIVRDSLLKGLGATASKDQQLLSELA